MSLLEDMVTFLKSEDLAEADGQDIFRDNCPEAPDSLVVLTEYQGTPIALHSGHADRSVQVMARDKSATKAKQKADALYSALCPDEQTLKLTATRWCIMHSRGVAIKIKTDKTNRVYYGFNVGITTNKD